MKKILYTASTFGHLSSFHRPYIAWLAAQGCRVDVAAGGAPCALAGVTQEISLPFEKSIAAPRNFMAAWRLSRMLRREKYDFISTHTALGAFFTRLAVLLAGKGDTVVMNTSHGYLFDADTRPAKRALLLGAERVTARVTDYVLTMNRQDTALARQYHLGREIFETPGMGVDGARFAPATPAQKQAAREALGIAQAARALVYVAEFSARKHHALLLRALPKLPPDVHLLLPGRGDTLEACRAEAQALHIEARVHFCGFLADVCPAYHAAELCVSASRIEGLPFNVMEAMCCGLPAVASAVKGHEDLIEPGVTGALYPYGDAEAFCKAVLPLLEDAALRARMGQAAQARMARYTRAAVQPQLLAIYARAAGLDVGKL